MTTADGGFEPDGDFGREDGRPAPKPQRQKVPLIEWVKQALGFLTRAYVVLLVLALILLEWWGERNWLLSLLLYAPAQLVLAPLLALTPLCLLLRRKMLLWHAAAVAMVLFLFMNFRWSTVPPRTATTVTGVTFNYGDSDREQFVSFLKTEKPDFIVLQDARGMGPSLARELPGMTVHELGRFILFSRFPVLKGAYVEGAKSGPSALAARWEVMIQDRRVAVYSVHMPTPRRELSQFLGRQRLLAGMKGDEHHEPGFEAYREWIGNRIVLAQSLADVFSKEELPMLVGGDFNTPDHGYIHHMFSSRMKDAFSHAGRGWGLTFPGSTETPVSLYGPWLRIDYFFAGRGWRPVECRPEPGGKSQHKAVLARFEPVAQ